MNQSNVKKLIFLTSVVLISLCFLPTVQGWGWCCRRRTNIRDIEDWLYAGNPFGAGPGYLDPDSMKSQRFLGTVFDADSYRGYIVEKLMRDGSLQYTLHIRVRGIPVVVIDWSIGECIFVGEVDYTYDAMFILDRVIPGGPLRDTAFDEETGEMILYEDNTGVLRPYIEQWAYVEEDVRDMGADLPAWWILYYYQYVIGGHFVWMNFVSHGRGNFIEPGWWFTDDSEPVLLERARVKVHQLAFYSWDLPLDNPDVYQATEWITPDGVFEEGGELQQSPLLMPEMWPIEYVKVFKLQLWCWC